MRVASNTSASGSTRARSSGERASITSTSGSAAAMRCTSGVGSTHIGGSLTEATIRTDETSPPPHVMAAPAATLLDQPDLADFDRTIYGLQHVVNRECGDGGRDQRFHLDARPPLRHDTRSNVVPAPAA